MRMWKRRQISNQILSYNELLSIFHEWGRYSLILVHVSFGQSWGGLWESCSSSDKSTMTLQSKETSYGESAVGNWMWLGLCRKGGLGFCVRVVGIALTWAKATASPNPWPTHEFYIFKCNYFTTLISANCNKIMKVNRYLLGLVLCLWKKCTESCLLL